MDLTQLRMFCKVVETGSVASAAKALQRVPSNLTTRLRQLEIELGADLFIREKQRLRLSPMGHNFVGYAQRILALSDEALNMSHTGEPAGIFAFGAMESTAVTHLPQLLAHYHQQYPQVSLSLTLGTAGDISEQVRSGTLAAALVDGPVLHDELQGCLSYDETLVLISDLGHAPIQTAEQVKQASLLAFRSSCSYRQRIESWFRQQQVLPGKIIEVHSYHAMLAAVASGVGLAVLPASVLALLPGHQQVQVHHLPTEIAETGTWLVWRRDSFSPTILALKELILAIEQRDLVLAK